MIKAEGLTKQYGPLTAVNEISFKVEPGEVLEITQDGKLNSQKVKHKVDPAFCVFEYVYFARPDSEIGGKSVYQVRKQMGAELAKEHPAQADLVRRPPDTGRTGSPPDDVRRPPNSVEPAARRAGRPEGVDGRTGVRR